MMLHRPGPIQRLKSQLKKFQGLGNAITPNDLSPSPLFEGFFGEIFNLINRDAYLLNGQSRVEKPHLSVWCVDI